MANDALNLGTATVSVKVDTTEVKPALEATKQEVSEATSTMGTDAEKNVGGGFQAAGEKIKETTKGIRTLSSAITATAGIITGLVGVVGLVAAAFKTAAEEAERMFLANQKMVVSTQQLREETDLALGALQGMAPEQQSLLQLQIESAVKQREIADLIRDGVVEAGAGYQITQDQLVVLKLQHEARLETIAAQREQVALLKAQADEAERLADAIERAKVGNEQLLLIQREMAGEFIPDILGPTREDMERLIKDMEKLNAGAKKAGESFAAAMTAAFDRLDARVSALNDSTSNTMEAVLRRIEVFVDNQGFGS